jgi:glycosyltransferase involved in cell wall biosynthesis
MPRSKFSIVTAVLDAGGTIGHALRSVAEQRYDPKEHVIQDGGSRDETLAVVRDVGTAIVRLESVRDAGVYDAFNRGLRRCTGDVIAFLGADDGYEGPGVLADVAAEFEDPDVDLVFGDVRFVDPGDGERIVRYYDSSRFRPDRLPWGVMPAHTATFVRRRVYESVGEFDTSYRIAGDFEWFVRAFRSRPLRYVYVRRPLVKMRTGGISTSGPAATWRITREFKRACDANGVATSYPRLLSRIPRKALGLLRE